MIASTITLEYSLTIEDACFTSMRRIVLFILLILLDMPVVATESTRPTVGLVLSGGGARGAAHIGVIEALEALEVPIDLIVGTSMGAVIGGLYASGIPIETIKHDFCDLNWGSMFKQDVKRKYLYFRRKLDDDIFISKNFIGMTNGKLHLSLGLTSGQNLYQIFKSYTIDQEPLPSFEFLPIPFRAVATDLLTGKTVALEAGDLALAMLASMAVPGIISPVKMNEYMLVDGGVSDNLPIQIAKQMGADIVIVVNVTSPLYEQSQIHDLTSVLGQISSILTNNNITESLSLLSSRDILITPTLYDVHTTNFEHFFSAIEPGRLATLAVKERLLPLAEKNYEPLSTSPYFIAPLRIHHIVVTRNHRFCRKTYTDFLSLDSTLVSVTDINQHINKLYGLNIFEKIYYGIDIADGVPYLEIKPRLKPKRSILFQESLLLHTDFRDDNQFSLVVGITDPRINQLLGEWRIVGSLGTDLGLMGELYQPLDPGLRWFVNPYVQFNREPYYLYYDFTEIARFINNNYSTGIKIGRNFSNKSRLYGYTELDYDIFDIIVTNPPLTSVTEKQWVSGFALEWDTLDNLYYPHHGIKGEASFYSTQSYFTASPHFTQLSAKTLAACSTGRHAMVLSARYNATLTGKPNLSSIFTLGGLFQLTGLQDNELMGANTALASALYFYEIKKIEFIPNRPAPVYIGGSFEVGNVWGERNISPRQSPIYSNSLFVGINTLLGPIYLGAGATYNGKKAIHLLVGPFF